MKTLKYRITGETPLVMHNGQLADPLNPITVAMKKITSKKGNKTEADMNRLDELGFKGGLYLYEGQPCIPGEVWEATIRSAAKVTKEGKKVETGVNVLESSILEYDGPKDIDGLWKDKRFHLESMVKVSTSKVRRVRPMFSEWSCVVSVMFVESLLNEEQVDDYVIKAGELGYLLEWLGKYGKYTAERL